MFRMQTCLATALTALALASMIAPLQPSVALAQEAPFGDAVGPDFTNYNRAWPTVGSAGLLKGNAVAEAADLGFRTVVDLRTTSETDGTEKAATEAAGMAYVHIPVATRAPTPEQVAQFSELMAAEGNKPILVHCASANRVGAIWALYRAGTGVSAMTAIEEGRVLGLSSSREPAVRAQLGVLEIE